MQVNKYKLDHFTNFKDVIVNFETFRDQIR